MSLLHTLPQTRISHPFPGQAVIALKGAIRISLKSWTLSDPRIHRSNIVLAWGPRHLRPARLRWLENKRALWVIGQLGAYVFDAPPPFGPKKIEAQTVLRGVRFRQ